MTPYNAIAKRAERARQAIRYFADQYPVFTALYVGMLLKRRYSISACYRSANKMARRTGEPMPSYPEARRYANELNQFFMAEQKSQREEQFRRHQKQDFAAADATHGQRKHQDGQELRVDSSYCHCSKIAALRAAQAVQKENGKLLCRCLGDRCTAMFQATPDLLAGLRQLRQQRQDLLRQQRETHPHLVPDIGSAIRDVVASFQGIRPKFRVTVASLGQSAYRTSVLVVDANLAPRNRNCKED